MSKLKVIVPIILGVALLGYLGNKFRSNPTANAEPKAEEHSHEEKEPGHDDHAQGEEKGHKDEHGHDEGKEHADHKEEGEHKEHGDHEEKEAGHDNKGEDHDDEHAHGKEEGHGDEHASGEEKGHGDGHGHGEEEGSDFGEGKAIVAVKNEGKQFQLSDESYKFLGVTTAPLKVLSPNVVSIKRDELVEYMSDVGIFVKNGQWIELKKVEVLSDRSDDLTIKVSNLKSGDQLITSPLRTLRAAHLVASGEGGKGHAH